MSLSAQFYHALSAKLSERGAQMAPRPMNVLSYGMTFLEKLNRATDDEVAIAGYLIALFKVPDAAAVAASLGIPATLIPPANARAGGVEVLTHALTRGSRDQAIAASVALYTWHAFAADAGETENAENIHCMAHAATLGGSENPELATDLVRAMDGVVRREAPPRPSSDYVYSISIDLCGSTDAKTRVLNNCRGNQQKIDEYNQLIYREFCRLEAKLFEGLVSQYGAGPAIDPRRLFTVKGIGDEMWSLCLTTEAKVKETGRRLIDAAVSIANECVNLSVPEHDDGGHFDPDFDYGQVEMVRSPIKIFIDLVKHATSISDIRDKVLREAVPNLLRDFGRLERIPSREGHVPDEDIAIVMRQLSVSTFEPVGRAELSSFRTDYIGHEIDRFFRTTKSALPGTVTIGDSMVQALGLTFEQVSGDIHRVLEAAHPLRGGCLSAPLYARQHVLPKEQLKGIGYDYPTYNLFHPLQLNGNYAQMNTVRDNGGVATAYDETIAKLATDVVDDLANRTVEEREALQRSS